MTTKLPIDLPVKSMTSKVSVGAHERLKQLSEETGFLMQDILSACLLHMPKGEIVILLNEQKDAVSKLPKFVKGLLRNVDKMSEAERALLRDVLS